MNKLFFFLIALLVVQGSADAQNDPNAKKILDAVSAKVKAYKAITGNFSAVTKTRAGRVNNTVSGKIVIKGNKYYIKQGASEIFSDGNKTWNYNGNDEVTVTSNDEDGEALTPQKLLTNFYDKDFSYKLVSSAGSYHQVQLIPIDKRKNFQKLNVFIDKSKMMITRTVVVDKSNNTINITLTNLNTSANIPDNTFVFNKSKYKRNIEIIE